ncbi:hypothetical protein HPB47_017259 [Ixodes persulcatus]|uniref:Uncharacterized protein n=1 Tax=Ixodes persulcatus TaxID=34615 RepID=A0AC60QNX1_IXOPE|nr:hypothetical protein HPB47_017259 [Ixodes persulcatus]
MALALLKAQSFLFLAPSKVPLDQIIGALYALVGEGSLTHLQHQGGSKFLAAVYSTEAAEKLVAQGNLLLGNVMAPLEQHEGRPHGNDESGGQLHQRCCRAPKYQGVQPVCARWSREGHFGVACNTPRCNHCGIFVHSTEGHTAPYKCCGHNHATTDCMQRRSYSAVAQAVDPPEPVPQVTAMGTPPSHGAASDAPQARPLAHTKAARPEA